MTNLSVVCACVCALAGILPSGAAERWAVAEGEASAEGGLYMISGDAAPECANAWLDPRSATLTRFDGSVVKDYFTATYSIPFRPINTNLIFKTPPVGWMTWYAVKFGASDSVVMRNARAFKEKFNGYTDEKPVLWVDWEWFHSRFREDGIASDTDMLSPRKDVYPRGLKPVADDLKALGFTPALWVSVFSDVRTNALWKARPDWVLGEAMTWCGAICGNPAAPGFCEEFVPYVFSLYKGWGYEAFKWDTVPVGYNRFKTFRENGAKIPSAGDLLRKCAKAMRRAVGDNCYVISCSGEIDPINLTAIDIFDGGRIGGDIFRWSEFRHWGVNRILSYQPFHNTVFWSDADNLVLRSEFSTEAQARTRVSIYALAGVPITMGDEISALDEKRIDIIRRAMPVVKLRPASLKRGGNAPDLLPIRADFARSFGAWQVRGWCNLTTNKTLNASLAVSDAVVWDYWRDRLVAVCKTKEKLDFAVSAGDTTLCRVTPLAKCGPTLVSVSRHVTQGGYELKEYAADERGATGVVRCPGNGEIVRVTFLLPEGLRIATASHAFDSDGRLVRLRLSSREREDVAFHLTLTNRPASSASQMQITFHRGLHERLPENTAEAIRAAFEAGARAVEVDFNEEDDGTILCYHDPRRRELVKPPYRVPTIDEVFSVVPKGGRLQCEIKKYGSNWANAFDAAARRHGLGPKDLDVSSFNRAALRDFHVRYPAYRTIWLFGSFKRGNEAIGVAEELISEARKLGVWSICPGVKAAQAIGLTRDDADRIRAAGFDFRLYGVNSDKSLKYAIELCASAFTTDKPFQMLFSVTNSK